MTWTLFANNTTPTGPQLDADLLALANLATIQCIISGTNTLALTPAANAPTISSYVLNQLFAGIATATNTGAVTANVASIGALPVYIDTLDGPEVLVGGEIAIGNYFILAFDSALNSGAGGFHLLGGQAANAVQSVAAGLTGAGTNQATALAITKDVNVFSTVALNTGAILADLPIGGGQWIYNRGANPLLVYPPVGGAIDALATNADYSLTNAKCQFFRKISAAQWYSAQLG